MMTSLLLKNSRVLLIGALLFLHQPVRATPSFNVPDIRYQVGLNGFAQTAAIGYASFQPESIAVEGFDDTAPTIYFTVSGSGYSDRDTAFFANTLDHSELKNESSVGFDRYATYNGSRVYYQLLSAPRSEAVIKDIGTPLVAENILRASVSPPSSQKATVPFYFRITPGQSLQPGVYDDTLRVSMFDTSPLDSMEPPLRCSILRVKIVVPTMMSIAISDDELYWKEQEFRLGIPKSLGLFSGSNVSINATVTSDDIVTPQFHVESQAVTGNQFRITVVPNSDRTPESKQYEQSELKQLTTEYRIQVRTME